MKLFDAILTILLPGVAAFESCAELEGKSVFLRAPWYSTDLALRGKQGERACMEFATDSMQVSAPLVAAWIRECTTVLCNNCRFVCWPCACVYITCDV